jgi:uncharacterized protein
MNESPRQGSVKFSCTRCGKCCISLGKHIRIERKAGPRDYYCRDMISGNLSAVHIDSPYVPFFLEKSVDNAGEENQCPFLVLMPEGYACAVYPTRPLICREFQCCRMRIFSPDGLVAGTIKGRRSLVTNNRQIQDLWDNRIKTVELENDGQWDMLVKRILEDEGFTVELYR